MDWDKVIANLREQAKYYSKCVNEYATSAGGYEKTREYRMCADFTSILASALDAGRQSCTKTENLLCEATKEIDRLNFVLNGYVERQR